ncbi:MAG: hypothetical protein Q8M64_07685 [Methyloversatilis sp.]|nr:hypothetical protein [Methyloversatilis sp.]MDP3455267.1 hypothetical protein [Methyloversatilis sp.]
MHNLQQRPSLGTRGAASLISGLQPAELLDLLQWPAMITTIAAAWLVASKQADRRHCGFWLFILSNVLWIAWGVQAAAPALIAMQLGLAAMNIRGAIKT